MERGAGYRLEDSLAAMRGRVLLSGTQALVRALLTQAQIDRARGWNTAGFVSGYRGSPLGGVDLALWKAQSLLQTHGVRFMPAVNEELAAAAAMGTQRVASDPARVVEGVFSMWYGKGPGLDRAGDTLRHGNAYGSSPRGGVLVVAGDDHGCVSSGMPFQSDPAMQAWSMPVLHPANVAELIEFALYGWAMSRATGAWVGLKALSETVERTATVDLDRLRLHFDAPAGHGAPADGLHYRMQDLPGLGIEARLAAKLDAVRAFARTNPLDLALADPARARVGILTCGKAHLDLIEALRRLEIPPEALEAEGVRVRKLGLVFPIEPEAVRAFAAGLDELLVVEEKAPVVETQVRALLYNLPPGERPRVVGKSDARGRPLLSALGELRPSRVMPVLAAWLAQHAPVLDRRAQVPAFVATPVLANEADGVRRVPYFCAGCPHNLSTQVPPGSEASAGIGCHGMAGWMGRNTSFPQVPMGSEGVDWVAQSMFTRARHRFQNMGDGTYSHSGYLAIRQAVASGARVTYKILYNDAVAMTGGQPVDRALTVPEIARQLEAEGVMRIAVVAEDPGRWRDRAQAFPRSCTLHARGELDTVQRELREQAGVTALIYDQVCATELRRRVKRGQVDVRSRRVFIHPEVCDNCGDCTAVSNCVAVKPLATPWGRRRQIDQSTCNRDRACLQADCPALVTVECDGPRRKTHEGRHALESSAAALPDPGSWQWTGPYDLVVAGVGGTGVITAGALIATAAHLEGKSASVLDFMGFAQKGGSVIAFVRLAEHDGLLHQGRIDTQQADAMIACDLVVGASPEALQSLTRGRTRVAVNRHEIPTAAFVADRDADVHAPALLAKIRHAIGGDAVAVCDATALAERILGDTVLANVLMIGFAWQLGLVPVGRDAIHRAIELNGVAVEANKLAFACGRLAAAAPAALPTTAQGESGASAEPPLEDVIEQARRRLETYQGPRLAARYLQLVARAQAAERAAFADAAPGTLARRVAEHFHRLLGVKDEYEVARLYSDGWLERALDESFEGVREVQLHLAPTFLVGRGPDGRPLRKLALGRGRRALLGLLARGRVLRGTVFDPFTLSAERRDERRFAAEYEAAVGSLLERPSAERYATAVQVAGLADAVRGYGHVRRAAIAAARTKMRELLAVA